jgi:hypothetical protein
MECKCWLGDGGARDCRVRSGRGEMNEEHPGELENATLLPLVTAPISETARICSR